MDNVKLEMHHQKTIWTRYATVGLGILLLVGLPTFGWGRDSIFWSDAVSGILLIIFGFFSFSSKKTWAPWIVCLIGIWLQLAPLAFWAPTAYHYLNDTFIGLAAIAFSILIPGTPGVVEETGPEIPLGWSYNPSAWAQRLPVITLAMLCWLTARFMSAYQLGYIHTMWDPIFGDGTLNVITSSVSKAFPVSDAGLGAAAYSIEALMGCKGGTRRWHTMPWIVTLFGILVVPVGLVSILLIMMQPLVVGAWCGWCLLTALFMLIMIALTVDEVAAMFQFLNQSRKEGHSLWKVFWKGSSSLEERVDKRSPPLNASVKKLFPAMCWGVTVPWNLVLSALIGIWLLFSPSEFGAAKSGMAFVDQISGALVVAISIISMAEVVRPLRFINLIFGIIILIAPWMIDTATIAEHWNNVIAGILLILLCLRKAKIKESYGSLDRCIK